MIRFKHSSDGSVNQFDFKFSGVSVSTEICVDKSRFKPSLVRNEYGQRVDGSVSTPQYHFSDGVDNGFPLTAINQIGSDVTEIDASQRFLESKINSQVHKTNEMIKQEVEKLEQVFKDSQKTSAMDSQKTSE